ncbi:conserved hypothetical protein [Candidatus Terasakiella magnetica]|nr:conserved hypothetical protein [Candidatus Terasakiella magnetica]
MDTTTPDEKSEIPVAAEAAAEVVPTPVADMAPISEPVPAPEPVPVPVMVSEPIPAPEPAAFLSSGVGASLRAAREARGKTLLECAKHLRIRQPFLEALEEGRHCDLPGGTYAAGFLRTYAEYLDLDSEELTRRFRQEGAGGFAAKAELSFPSPVTEGRIPGGAVIFLGLILAAFAYGGWYLLSTRESKVAEMVPPLPDRLSSVLNRQAALTGDSKPSPSEPGKPGEEVARVREEVVPPPETEDDKHPAAPPPAQMQPAPEPPKVEPPKAEPPKVEPPKAEPPKAEPPKAEPPKVEPPKAEPPKVEPPKAEPPKVEPPKADASPAADGRVFGTEHTDARVTLKATGDDCWVQVREMDGSLLVSRLLRRGDSYRVPNRPGLNLMVGNAGSLEVTVDGRKAPALGATGQVRRDIRLDPDKLLSGG